MTRATGSAFIQKGPKALSKGKSYLMERTHKLFLCNTSPSRIKKTKQKQGKKVVSFFWSPVSGMLGVRTPISARTSDQYKSLVDRMIKHQRPLWSVLLVLIPEV